MTPPAANASLAASRDRPPGSGGRGGRLLIETRPKDGDYAGGDLPPFLAAALAARGVYRPAQRQLPLGDLLSPALLPGVEAAAERLAAAVVADERIVIAGDFDADGATAAALCVSLLRAFGAGEVSYAVPDRFKFGYGFTPEFAQRVLAHQPALIVTVDSGVTNVDGVALAQAAGADVIVTDHHLPGEELPRAHAIVNPNLAGARFASPNLAGVGVAYYLMAVLRQALRERGHFTARGITPPNLAQWLDLVAIGTVADVVPLDRNNRILVHQGLRRIRAGLARPGVKALVQVAGRAPERLSAADLGFAIAPRLNAAGRLENMAIGIDCLLAPTVEAALPMTRRLDELNRTRREIEADMTEDAAALAEIGDAAEEAALCLYERHWHQGVVGIVAGRMRERYGRPVIAFADAGPAAPDELKGSARSIPALHIRDAIADCAARQPGLIAKFGGHAAAAGLSLRRGNLPRFRRAFIDAVAARVSERDLSGVIVTDGELAGADLTLDNAKLVARNGPWGQGFPEPVFHGDFAVVSERVVGDRHLRLVLKHDGRVADAIAFNQEPLDARRARAVYRLGIDDYADAQTLRLQVERIERLD